MCKRCKRCNVKIYGAHFCLFVQNDYAEKLFSVSFLILPNYLILNMLFAK